MSVYPRRYQRNTTCIVNLFSSNFRSTPPLPPTKPNSKHSLPCFLPTSYSVLHAHKKMTDHSLSLYTPKRDLSAAAATTRRFSLSAAASATKPSSSSSSAAADLSKKHVKKSLKSVLASVAVEASAVDLSPVSEVVHNEEKSCNVEVVDPDSTPESELIFGDLLPLGTQSSTEISPSSEASTLSDLTCSFDKAASITEKSRDEVSVCETLKTCSVEAYVVADHLKQAGIQVMRSKDVDDGMKKLVDALINVLLKEVYAVPDGKEKGKYRVESLYSIRVCITFVSLMLWIVVLAVAVLMMLGADDRDPWRIPPT
ncbi:hypothetical protein Drorol1_Dr00011858 [Drosera rotundifolia]